ncbi:MAG: DUF4160 domain-containing protein [Synergistaceae bacterium]|nr:DUF4160 domain-containing protein [Synergistaceae bacterium]MBQ9582688.1 DUF4160 domain-containing protein [Synergistaceae bacterium]
MVYGDYVGVINIKTLELLEGDLPPKALAMIKEWAGAHQDELLEIWDTQNFKRLPPLE